MLEQTDAAVAGIINKFSAITPELMNTFRNQLNVSYTYDIIGIGICSIFLLLGIIGLTWAIKTFDKNSFDGFTQVLVGVFSLVIIFVSILVAIMIGFDLVQLNLNPDYYILQNYIKPLITGSS